MYTYPPPHLDIPDADTAGWLLISESIFNIDRLIYVCVCSVCVPCVALPSGGRSSVGPSPLCGSPVWVPCVGPLCGSPVWVPSVWVPCVGPLCGSLVALRPCGIYSRDVSRSFTRSRSWYLWSFNAWSGNDDDTYNPERYLPHTRTARAQPPAG